MGYGNQAVPFRAIANDWSDIPSNSEIYADQRTFLKKSMDRSLSIVREVSYACRNFRGRFVDYFNPSFDGTEADKAWKVESKGLYVLVHGLNGHPVIWQSHIDQLKNDQEIDLFVPYVPMKGNGPFEEIASPILNTIQDYTSKYPTKPICLIGVSNGGRICTWLETRLRSSAPSTPVRVSTIAAVHFGSSRMDLVNLCHQWTNLSLGYHPAVVKDLCFGSEKAKEILNEVAKPLSEGTVRAFECFASTEDSQVPELFSSLLKLESHEVVEHIVHGYDHNGIVSGVSDDQIKSCNAWMNNFSN